MKKNIVGSVILLFCIHLLPYASRLYRGVDWAAQYQPCAGHVFLGQLFFGAFASLPAIPLIVAFCFRKRFPMTFLLSTLTAAGLLVYWHHDYDLAADAQAAIGLILIPLRVSRLTALAGAVVALVEWRLKRRRMADGTRRRIRRVDSPI